MTKATHDKSIFEHFSANGNQIVIAKKTLAQLEHIVGGTPFYVYDKTIIKNKVDLLKKLLPNKISIHYAIKANPLPSLIDFLAPLVDGFDVASQKELIKALQSGMCTSNISFAGPGKTNKDIAAAICAGVTINVESMNEFHRIIALSDTLSCTANIAFRVNPKFELKSSGMQMAGGAKPFGIDEELLIELLPTLDYDKFNFIGFHIFCGSQNLNAASIIEAHQATFALIQRLQSITPVEIKSVNIGGGFGIPYFPKEQSLELTLVAENLAQLISYNQNIFTNIEIIIELGRFIVGESGIYVSKVIDEKQSRGTSFLVVDGGLHHHLANSGNFGQVIRKNFPVAIGNRLTSTEPLQQVTIVGPLCTPLDIVADKVLLPKAKIGDYIIIYQSGAYGASASPKDFLSQSEVKELLL